jgi:hypothetical protein
MKEGKIYQVEGFTTDENGVERGLIVVGEVTREKKYVVTDFKDTGKKATMESVKKWERTLRYSYAICHTTDLENFDVEEGKRIALRRLRKHPLGELKTTRSSCLGKAQVDSILFGEWQYISGHMDEFIRKLNARGE